MRELTIDELKSVSGGIKTGGGGMTDLGWAARTITNGIGWALGGVAKVCN